MTFEEKLAQAFRESFDERMERRMTVEKEHKFSLAYRLWEWQTIRSLRKKRYNKHWTLRRARCVIMAAVIGCSLLLGVTAYAVGSAIVRYAVDAEPFYSRLFVGNLSSDKTSLEEYYELSADGWEAVERHTDDTGTFTKYKCGEKEMMFSQNVIWGNSLNFSTQNTVMETVSVYEENDGFFIAFKNRKECGLYWIYDGYLFILFGDLDKTEAVNYAHSTKKQQNNF